MLVPKGSHAIDLAQRGRTIIGQSFPPNTLLERLLFPERRTSVVTAPAQGMAMLSVLIGVLIICIVGAICFWLIDRFINESRLANLLRLLVVLICVAAILQRVLPLAGANWL
jgi:hypothetical protein